MMDLFTKKMFKAIEKIEAVKNRIVTDKALKTDIFSDDKCQIKLVIKPNNEVPAAIFPNCIADKI